MIAMAISEEGYRVIRRREKVVRIFLNMQAAWPLIVALRAEQHEE